MQVARWGNSLAVRIPASVAEALGLKEGDDIEVVIAGDRRFEVQKDASRSRALARLKAMQKPLPKGFRFDRNDANER